ncbi:MAG: MFS transporter [Pseudomonadota bacterium]|nr:MFS transporter [Pseudomonadota bacterium]
MSRSSLEPSTPELLVRMAAPSIEVERSRRYAWYVVAMLLAVSVLGYLDRLILSLLISPIKAELGLTDTQVGMITGMAFALLYVIAGIPIGQLIDKSNRIVVLAVCVLIWSVATAGGGLASSFIFLFLARVGVGAGEAGVSPAAVSLIGDYFPANQVQQPLSVFTVGLYAGGGLAIILGAEAVAYLTSLGPIALPIIGTMPAWRITFLSLGVPGIIVAALLLLTVRNPPRRQAAISIGAGEASALAYAQAHRKLLMLLVSAVVLWGMNGYGFINWYPEMLIRSFGMSAHMVARTYGIAFLVGGTLGALALAPLVTLVARRGRTDAVFLVSGVALATLTLSSAVGPLMPSRVGVIAFASLSILCQSLVVASVYTIITKVAPSALRGAYTGVYMCIMNITGGAFGAVLVGMLADRVVGAARLNVALSIMAVIFGPISTLFMWLAGREFRRTLGTRETPRARFIG